MCDHVGVISEIDTILHSDKEGWNKSGMWKLVGKQCWNGAEDDTKINSIHKCKLQPMRLRQYCTSWIDAFLCCFLIIFFRVPRVTLTFDEMAAIIHLVEKNVDRVWAIGCTRWCSMVETIAGVVKLAKLTQIGKQEDIEFQLTVMAVYTLEGVLWPIAVLLLFITILALASLS